MRHALRLSLLPVVSYLGPATASILVGSVVVEKIFSIPGLGETRFETVAVDQQKRELFRKPGYGTHILTGHAQRERSIQLARNPDAAQTSIGKRALAVTGVVAMETHGPGEV